MFGILHWKSNNGSNKEAMFVEKPHGLSSPETNSACNRCRVRKVKCSINNSDTCNRCKRLGKQCNFSLKTHRGSQHTRKENTNVPELEYAEMVWLKDNKLPLVSSSPSENTPENGYEAPCLSAELSRGHASVGSRHDMLVDEFHQSPSDQDGDDIFNFSSLPLPFELSNSPITPPDSAHSTIVTPLDDFLAWATCPGDEIPPTLPPTTHSEDLSLVDISFNTTLMSSQTSAADSAVVTCYHTSGQSSCLAASVFAVEHFEVKCICNNRAQLDSILASQKEAIKRCRSMVKCAGCMARRENLVVLVFMTEKIVEACGRIVALYGSLNLNNTLPSLDSSSISLESLSSDILLPHGHNESLSTSTSSLPKMNNDDSCLVTATSSNAASNWRGLLVGDYKISSSLEWEYLVRLLIFLQLKALLQLLADIKDTGHMILGETQMASLTQAESRIDELVKELSAK